ncbi:hypothetical protein [Clostridium thailandense]
MKKDYLEVKDTPNNEYIDTKRNTVNKQDNSITQEVEIKNNY